LLLRFNPGLVLSLRFGLALLLYLYAALPGFH
jgi:hypothetical protein